jgi:mono/diheme cytochrome c family protein
MIPRPVGAALDSPTAVGNDDGVLASRVVATAALAATLAGCSGGESGLSPEAERGRQVYLAQCTACHGTDPARNGPVGPAVKGSSRALLEARVLRGAYPPGYTPKRPGAVMQPMPQLRDSLDDLAAYLR